MDWERWGLRLVALGLFITLLTPELGAPPANDTPITCTQDDLSEALRRFESTIKAQKAIIVVGAEGSGSKLAALAAAQTLEAAAFRSPSFPPPYDPSCAESRGVWKTGTAMVSMRTSARRRPLFIGRCRTRIAFLI